MCVVPGVLKESQQREVFAEGPACCPDAEGPQVPSTSAGGWDAFNSAPIYVLQKQTTCYKKKKGFKASALLGAMTHF